MYSITIQSKQALKNDLLVTQDDYVSLLIDLSYLFSSFSWINLILFYALTQTSFLWLFLYSLWHITFIFIPFNLFTWHLIFQVFLKRKLLKSRCKYLTFPICLKARNQINYTQFIWRILRNIVTVFLVFLLSYR
jgi:hypothetical protein